MNGETEEQIFIIHEQSDRFDREEKSMSWSRHASLLLLDLYKKYKKELGTLKIRNYKRMWEIISHEINILGIKATPANCENRWRVLERNYRKSIDNVKQTGAGRKIFEYLEEMQDILGKKRNICPELLASSSNVYQSEAISVNEKENILEMTNNSLETTEVQEVKVTKGKSLGSTTIRKSSKKKPRNVEVLEKIRSDRLQYQQHRLELEREKIEKISKIEETKIEHKKQRNKLLEENNRLLQEQNELLRRRYT